MTVLVDPTETVTTATVRIDCSELLILLDNCTNRSQPTCGVKIMSRPKQKDKTAIFEVNVVAFILELDDHNPKTHLTVVLTKVGFVHYLRIVHKTLLEKNHVLVSVHCLERMFTMLQCLYTFAYFLSSASHE